jgi:hypothetical protein
MFFRAFASVAAFAAAVGATTPALVATLARRPTYSSTVDTDLFAMNCVVAIKGSPAGDGEVGVADFTISVTVKTKKEGKPYVFTVNAACENEEFELSEGSLLFDPYPEEAPTCTRAFIQKMNEKFGAAVVESPIALSAPEDGARLIFNFQGAEIPLMKQ